ncbi:MAG TPA: ankyrin repeat domain-containing protein [Vicinamibacterales bacterium]
MDRGDSPVTPEWKNAVRTGDVSQLDALARAGADIDARDEHGQTGLMIAARDGQAPVVRWLVEHGANLDHTAKFHLSALMLAVINGRDAIVGILVDAGADRAIEGSGAPGFAGKTALDIARAGNREIMIALLGE